MKQTIYKNGKYLTLDKKIPTMKALLVTDGQITASADEFILQDIAPDAQIIDLKGGLLLPGFVETYSSILDRARNLLKEKPEVGDLNTALSQVCSAYASFGITTAANARTSREDYEILKKADEAGAILIDIPVYLRQDAADLLPEVMPVHNEYSSHIRLAGLSVMIDEMTDDETVVSIFARSIKNHWQTAVEVNSEKALKKVIDGYWNALILVNGSKTDEDGLEKPKIYEDLRPLLCGCAHIPTDYLTKLQSLGFTPCFTHDNVFYNGEYYAKNLSQDAADNIYPLRSIVRRGMAFSMQHDTGFIVPDMIATMHIACNRVMRSGHTLGLDQSINSDQAVNALTLFATYQLGEDLSKGSLTPGKRADFVVLDKNPLELSDANIQNINVLMTIKDDEVLYRK